MKPGSEFLRELNDVDVKVDDVQYAVVAGDTSIYRSGEKDGRMQRFFDKALIEVGGLANTEHQHDAVVGLKSILNSNVWKDRGMNVTEADLMTVACHHVNYFTTEIGKDALASVLIDD